MNLVYPVYLMKREYLGSRFVPETVSTCLTYSWYASGGTAHPAAVLNSGVVPTKNNTGFLGATTTITYIIFGFATTDTCL